MLCVVMQTACCCTVPAGDPFETFNLAIAFPPDVPLALPQNITAYIVRLQVRTCQNVWVEKY
jgi:hypothetical protein